MSFGVVQNDEYLFAFKFLPVDFKGLHHEVHEDKGFHILINQLVSYHPILH